MLMEVAVLAFQLVPAQVTVRKASRAASPSCLLKCKPESQPL